MKIAYLFMIILMVGSFQAAHGQTLRNPQEYTYRGLSRQREGDLDGAIEDFTRAIELDPATAEAYANRAVIESLQGKRALADQDFERAFKIDPESEGAVQRVH